MCCWSTACSRQGTSQTGRTQCTRATCNGYAHNPYIMVLHDGAVITVTHVAFNVAAPHDTSLIISKAMQACGVL